MRRQLTTEQTESPDIENRRNSLDTNHPHYVQGGESQARYFWQGTEKYKKWHSRFETEQHKILELKKYNHLIKNSAEDFQIRHSWNDYSVERCIDRKMYQKKLSRMKQREPKGWEIEKWEYGKWGIDVFYWRHGKKENRGCHTGSNVPNVKKHTRCFVLF